MTTKLTPLKAIKVYCKESCCAGEYLSWKECTFVDCPLFVYRMGTNPNRKGINKKIKDKE